MPGVPDLSHASGTEALDELVAAKLPGARDFLAE